MYIWRHMFAHILPSCANIAPGHSSLRRYYIYLPRCIFHIYKEQHKGLHTVEDFKKAVPFLSPLQTQPLLLLFVVKTVYKLSIVLLTFPWLTSGEDYVSALLRLKN